MATPQPLGLHVYCIYLHLVMRGHHGTKAGRSHDIRAATWLQVPFDATVRISLDTNLAMIKENVDGQPVGLMHRSVSAGHCPHTHAVWSVCYTTQPLVRARTPWVYPGPRITHAYRRRLVFSFSFCAVLISSIMQRQDGLLHCHSTAGVVVDSQQTVVSLIPLAEDCALCIGGTGCLV